MLQICFEFRKGIFFIRLIGTLNKETYQTKEKELEELIIKNKFKYIVINTNYLNEIDLMGLNCLAKICYTIKASNSTLVVCDKSNVLKTLFNDNIPAIRDELEVL